ncbi:MAG TPA: glycosyltransferase [Candidatus Dormibacteraeota bacterium]|nr:glycosyltransferase [Candidatus Dormibacteraeota bacterium]
MTGARPESDGALVAPPPPAGVQALNSPPSISVIVPAYEAAGTIGETVESVLAQSQPAHEVIVVDDGSADGLTEALSPFRDRIALVRNPHGGVAAARNAGWRRCTGDFVLIVDADDVISSEKLRALGRLGQQRPDLDLLCTDMYFESEGRRTGRFGEVNPFPRGNQRQVILERCFAIQPAFRRSSLESVDGFDESLLTAEDWDCVLRLILNGSAAGLWDEPLATYRIHPGSLTASRQRTLRDRSTILEKALRNPALRPEEHRFLERSLLNSRARVSLAAAQSALAEGTPGARRLGLRLAGTAAAPLWTRLWGLALAIAPARLHPWLLKCSSASSQLLRVLPGEGGGGAARRRDSACAKPDIH